MGVLGAVLQQEWDIEDVYHIMIQYRLFNYAMETILSKRFLIPIWLLVPPANFFFAIDYTDEDDNIGFGVFSSVFCW